MLSLNKRLRVICSLLLLALVGCTAACRAQSSSAGDRPITDKWALIVGVGEFPKSDLETPVAVVTNQGIVVTSGRHTNSLTNTVKDACDLRNFLIDKAHFAPSHVKLLLQSDATHDNILYNLGEGWLQKVVKPDDLVVLYFSTHGALVKSGETYIVPYDYDYADQQGTGISMEQLGQQVKNSMPNNNRVVVIADTCFAGNMQTTRGLFHGKNDPIGVGQIAVSACSASETSLDEPILQNGLFTWYLLDRLDKYKGDLKKALDDTSQSVAMAAKVRMHEQHPTVNYSRWSDKDQKYPSLFATPTNATQ